MTRWPTRTLGELVEFVGGGTPRRDRPDYWEGDIPWASVKDLQSQSLETTLECITTEGLTNSASKLIPEGTVIIASRVGLGKVAINRKPVAINQDLKALILRSVDLLPRYLLLFLLSKAEYLERAGVGATVKGLTIPDYQKLNVVLPPLIEQERIVKLLDEADELHKLRTRANVRISSLTPAIFHEIFGNIVADGQKWMRADIASLSEQVVVGHVGPTTHGYSESGVAFLRTQNVRPMFVDTSNIRYITSDFDSKLTKSKLKMGDVVISRVGANRGMSAVIPAELNGANCANIVVVRPRGTLDPYYLSFLINSQFGQSGLLGTSVGSAQGVINTTSVKRFRIPSPPLPLQRQFAMLAMRISELEAKQAVAEKSLNALFESLLQRAFQGEL
jgi:type I restriction enzyme, S subunit